MRMCIIEIGLLPIILMRMCMIETGILPMILMRILSLAMLFGYGKYSGQKGLFLYTPRRILVFPYSRGTASTLNHRASKGVRRRARARAKKKV